MNAHYVFAADINNSPCITSKKQVILDKIKNIDNEMILIIIKEIESWYLAGLDDKLIHKYKIRRSSDTNTTTKEQFNNLIPKYFESRIDFMIEILKSFSFKTAIERNKSFKYFIEKYTEYFSEKTQE